MDFYLDRICEEGNLLNKQDILDIFKYLNERLRDNSLKLTLNLYGGSMMLLLFDNRPATRDVDCILAGDKESTLLSNILLEIKARWGLQDDWLNEDIAEPLVTLIQEELEVFRQYSNLIIVKPSSSQLLAMKVLSSRVEPHKDFIDAKLLCRNLQISTEKEIYKIVEKFLPKSAIGERQRMFIYYLVKEM